MLKALEFYCRTYSKLKDFDIIWCADTHVLLFPLLLSKKRKIIWDLHEIPMVFLGGNFKRKIFNYIEKKCALFYHANKERIYFLEDKGLILSNEKHFALRNYPDKISEYTPVSDSPIELSKFNTWLGESKCVYLQGIYGEIRRSYPSMAAVMEVEGLKAVIVGRPDKDAVNHLIQVYGEAEVSNKLFFTGMIPQRHTYQYISHCHLSLIFYATCNPNNTYCDPNRLFQAVVSGLPVVVGNNPPMKEFVSKTGAGIALNSDGNRIEEIVCAIKEILSKEEQYVDSIKRNNQKIYWDSQEVIIKHSFEKIL